jgi:15-cis-phytoene synthase
MIADGLYREAAAATARGSKSFFLASRFFPPEMARSAHAVYWFCRHTDDLVDECPTPDQGRRDLEAWAAALRQTLAGQSGLHPILDLFAHTVRTHAIPHEFPFDLIEGMRMDLAAVRYRTFTDLRVFCYRVASVVGLMMTQVIGFRDPAPAHAIDLGIAMQLTNILRDVGEDLDRGRIYLPLEEMAEAGYPEADLHARRVTPAFIRLMESQAERARWYYRQAEPGIPLLDRRGRFAVYVASDVYRGILARIEANGYDVFSRRAVVPAWRKYSIAARRLAAPAARSSLERLAFWRA